MIIGFNPVVMTILVGVLSGLIFRLIESNSTGISFRKLVLITIGMLAFQMFLAIITFEPPAGRKELDSFSLDLVLLLMILIIHLPSFGVGCVIGRSIKKYRTSKMRVDT
ncbi:hypothetical protein [Glaciecola sp. KUL10]|uniref:hypothetical protein n=1 Tax=Glaciecola sp. (strain KUL10) TaxID=2161813 RepID=UPI000D782992|nr:hypothetical protein [Glaciecola sp. KUL10]GBL04328.1 hypothetical protein KUL10_16340 [Glaciecola sp. KUL10]